MKKRDPKADCDDDYFFWHGFGSIHTVSGEPEDENAVDLLYEAAEKVTGQSLRRTRKIGFY